MGVVQVRVSLVSQARAIRQGPEESGPEEESGPVPVLEHDMLVSSVKF